MSLDTSFKAYESLRDHNADFQAIVQDSVPLEIADRKYDYQQYSLKDREVARGDLVGAGTSETVDRFKAMINEGTEPDPNTRKVVHDLFDAGKSDGLSGVKSVKDIDGLARSLEVAAAQIRRRVIALPMSCGEKSQNTHDVSRAVHEYFSAHAQSLRSIASFMRSFDNCGPTRCTSIGFNQLQMPQDSRWC